MNPVSLAMVLNLATLAGFVLFAGWLLLRIERHTEAAAVAQEQAMRDNQAMLRELRKANDGTEDQIRQLIAEIPPPPNLKGLATRTDMQVLTGQLRVLLNRATPMPMMSPASAPAPAAGGAQASPNTPSPAQQALEDEVRRLTAQRGRLEGEVTELRERLHEQARQNNDLRLETREANNTQNVAAALRSANEQLMQEVREARERNRDLQGRLDPLTTELQALRVQMTALANAPSLAGEDLEQALKVATEGVANVYETQMKQMQNELNQLHEQNLQQQEAMARMLREKSFIEEKFLDLAEAGEAA
ncbi:MAG: hypothetical protein ACK5QH_08140 [Rubrivivax sp.]|jgi:hypothetical protein